MSDDIKKLEKERDYWKRVAAYLATLHAATLEYDGSLKSVSRARKDRMLSFASIAADLMDGHDGELGVSYARSTIEDAAYQCRVAVILNGGEV